MPKKTEGVTEKGSAFACTGAQDERRQRIPQGGRRGGTHEEVDREVDRDFALRERQRDRQRERDRA